MKMKFAYWFIFCSFSMIAQPLVAQEGEKDATPVLDIFHGTRGVNQHTVRQMGKKVLSYRISHRWGELQSGFQNLFGLDGPSSIYIGFDYGLFDKLTIGIGRTSTGKLLEGFAKYNFLDQTMDNSTPISLALYTKANLTHTNAKEPSGFDPYANFAHRMSYTTQLLVARKFGERISLQIAPTYIHFNQVEGPEFANDIIAIGATGEFKFTKKLSATLEYSYVVNEVAPSYSPIDYRNSFGAGLNIATGGHVFQILLVNTFTTNDTYGIPYNDANWADGGFRLGFNISRSFWL